MYLYLFALGNQLNQAQEKAKLKFFEDLYEALKRHVDLDQVKAVIVGR
jgi:hypothetical protein